MQPGARRAWSIPTPGRLPLAHELGDALRCVLAARMPPRTAQPSWSVERLTHRATAIAPAPWSAAPRPRPSFPAGRPCALRSRCASGRRVRGSLLRLGPELFASTPGAQPPAGARGQAALAGHCSPAPRPAGRYPGAALGYYDSGGSRTRLAQGRHPPGPNGSLTHLKQHLQVVEEAGHGTGILLGPGTSRSSRQQRAGACLRRGAVAGSICYG